MKKLVLKFGGTSVGSVEKIKNVAKIIKKRHSEGNQIIVVVSAMAGETNQLLKKSDLISKNFDNQELDVLLSSGEQVSCSLLSGAIIDLGIKEQNIKILGKGEIDLNIKTNDETPHPANRRAEISPLN